MVRKNKQRERLARLAASLDRFEALVRQGPAADPEQIRSAVLDLTKRVCHRPPDFDAAARVHGREGITFGGRHYQSHTEALYLNALGDYQYLMERTTGFPDDELNGYLDAAKVVAHWPAVVAGLQGWLLAPQELVRLAAEAAQEAEAGHPLPPPPMPTVYRPPGVPADCWSPAAVQQQTARLTAYRETPAPAGSAPPGSATDIDVLTFVKGEPPDRFVTKVGGLPYRPASVAWPVRPSGQPMAFLAQFCFADSSDLVGALPGDVLVVFARDEEAFLDTPHGDDPPFRFEWYPLGLEGLVTAAAVPRTSWKLLPCYTRLERREEEPSGYEGVKIGGTPYWLQHPLDVSGRFLAALGQLRLNETQDERAAGYRYLRMADAGLLNLFWEPDGRITWDFQSY
jgi:hypothetical protein